MSVNVINGELRGSLDNAQFVSMRELNQRTAQVIDGINETGRPAMVTKHGRFVAVLLPMANAPIETIVLGKGRIASEINDLATRPDREARPIEDVVAEFGEADDA